MDTDLFRLSLHETLRRPARWSRPTGASDGAFGPPNARSRVCDGRCVMAAAAIYKGKRAVASLSQDFERLVAVAAIAVNRKIPVEAGSPRDPQPLHHGKAGPVDERESLVREAFRNCPCRLGVSGCQVFDHGYAVAYPAPKRLGRGAAHPTVQEEPRLDQDMIARQWCGQPAKDLFRSIIVLVANIGCREP